MQKTIRFVRKIKEKCFQTPTLTETRLKQLTASCNQYIQNKAIPATVKILWPTLFNQDQTWWAHDGVLINALRLRGADVLPTLCNQLQSDECVIHGGLWQKSYERLYGQTRASLCNQCVQNDLRLWQIMQLEPIRLSQFISKTQSLAIWAEIDALFQEDWQNITYNGYALGKEIFKAVVNNNLQGEIRPHWQAEAKQIARHHAYNVIALMKAYEQVIATVTPDKVVGNGGFYYQWGVLNHLCQQKNIPYYRYYGIGLKPMSWNYALNCNDMVHLTPAWRTWQIQPWGTVEANKVRADLEKRGHCFDLTTAPDIRTRVENLHAQLVLQNKPTLLAFAGIIWDAATNVPSDAFANMYQWLFSTIEWFGKNPQYQLIIRAHPAEDIGPMVAPEHRTRFEKELIERGVVIPENVFIIKTDEKIDTYDLMHLADVGVVYTSTTGLEFACLGKPLITVGRAHYSHKGFTFEPRSSADYFNKIDRLLVQKWHGEQQAHYQELAMKYWYLFAFHGSTVTGLFETKKQKGLFAIRGMEAITAHPKALSASDLLPGKNAQLDYLCDSIMNNLPIMADNRWPPLNTEDFF
jgi:hypothetical protein